MLCYARVPKQQLVLLNPSSSPVDPLKQHDEVVILTNGDDMAMVQDIVRIHCTCLVDSLKPIEVCSGWADQLSCVQIVCPCILFNNIKLWVYCISCRIKRETLKKELDKCQGICRRLSMRALQEVRVKAAMEEWGSGTCMQVVYMQLQCRKSKANTPFCTQVVATFTAVGTLVSPFLNTWYIHYIDYYHPFTHTNTNTHFYDVTCTNYCELCGNNVSLMLQHALGVFAQSHIARLLLYQKRRQLPLDGPLLKVEWEQMVVWLQEKVFAHSKCLAVQYLLT